MHLVTPMVVETSDETSARPRRAAIGYPVSHREPSPQLVIDPARLLEVPIPVLARADDRCVRQKCPELRYLSGLDIRVLGVKLGRADLDRSWIGAESAVQLVERGCVLP